MQQSSNILKTVLIPFINELSILTVVVCIGIVLRQSLSKEIDRPNQDLKILNNIQKI
jgi:uncharacterized membrane protein